MSLQNLRSSMADSIRALVELRQSLGYRDKAVICYLRNFDTYLADTGRTETFLTRQLVEEWASRGGPLKPHTRAVRLQALRVLGRFLAQSFPETYIPGPTWGNQQESGFRPHIYTSAEVQSLLREAERLSPAGSLRPLTYRTLFSVLYCSGLRISEALALNLGDVDLETGVLLIRDSKFHKSRSLPLNPTAVDGLRLYLKERNRRGHCRDLEAPFFVNERKRRCNYGTVIFVFVALSRRAGLRNMGGTQSPRIHDLRHTFAVNRLLAWYRDGGDVQARLPLLSTYLGHTCIVSTQVYLEITAELLDQAVRRFQPPQTGTASSQGGLS